jgi:hypothetical protein
LCEPAEHPDSAPPAWCAGGGQGLGADRSVPEAEGPSAFRGYKGLRLASNLQSCQKQIKQRGLGVQGTH